MKENRWLAFMGYTTMHRLCVSYGYTPMDFDALSPAVQRAWEAAAAGIRRRVVAWNLPGEEGGQPPFGGIPPVLMAVDAMRRAWARLPFEERLQVLAAMLTPAERRALVAGLGETAQDQPCPLS